MNSQPFEAENPGGDGDAVPWTCTSVQAFLAGHPDATDDEMLDAAVAHIEHCAACGRLLDVLSPAVTETENASDPFQKMAREIVAQLESARVRPTGGELRDLATERRLYELGRQFVRAQVLHTSRSTFRIVGLMRSRKYTETYLAEQEIVENGQTTMRRAVIAVPKVEDVSGQAAEDRLIQLHHATSAQATQLQRLTGLPYVAQLIDSGEYVHYLGDRMVNSTFLAYEYVEGTDLRSFLGAKYADGGAFTGLPTATEFFRWARYLATAVRGIHQRLVIHGDLCPENLLVDQDGKPVLINVGKFVFVDGRSDVREFRGSAYRAPDGAKTPMGDLYSVGALLFFLATGKEPDGVRAYPDRCRLKKEIAEHVKKANPGIYRHDPSIVDIIVACLRRDQHRGRHAGELLQDIEIFEPLAPPLSILEELMGLTDTGAVLEKTGNALFRAIAGREIRALQQVMADMSKGVFDISGTSHEIRSAAYSLIATLQRADSLVAISVPRYWSRQNIFTNGKYLTMNLNAAARGARIRRLLLVDTELSDAELPEIVQAQVNGRADLDESVRENYQVRYVAMSARQRDRLIANGRHFAMLIKDGDRISMFPVYDGERLVTLRFRSDPRYAEGLVEAFEILWEEARPLEELADRIAVGSRTGSL